MTIDSPRWVTASRSNNGGQCVQVAVNLAFTRGVVPVRDSKNLAGPVLMLPADVFASFVAGIKGESRVM
ncbi:DUF397 domain-containing protein [Streptomyces griseoviridis]|uniref:DUF397 domain-containing protein n=1 Tax=Streptomyces griseoviridis TaxID=45398 RepID=A0A3S9ZD01_STRGD|nr:MULTISPECIES: DUF397 domain-containing protein [Streptomyces]AZS85509.1 DUF397 domain-containing protein [Streptomyces griseoviridis]MDH6698878.1 hypothetical protein [Streptomyces sp. MAA16]QCN90739.1 DUF397 domain-containing protein [Streptomyces griseoviridis]